MRMVPRSPRDVSLSAWVPREDRAALAQRDLELDAAAEELARMRGETAKLEQDLARARGEIAELQQGLADAAESTVRPGVLAVNY